MLNIFFQSNRLRAGQDINFVNIMRNCVTFPSIYQFTFPLLHGRKLLSCESNVSSYHSHSETDTATDMRAAGFRTV